MPELLSIILPTIINGHSILTFHLGFEFEIVALIASFPAFHDKKGLLVVIIPYELYFAKLLLFFQAGSLSRNNWNEWVMQCLSKQRVITIDLYC